MAPPELASPITPTDADVGEFIDCVRIATDPRATNIGQVFCRRCPSLTQQERSRVYRAAIRQGLVVVADGNGERAWYLPGSVHEGGERRRSDSQRAFIECVRIATDHRSMKIGQVFSRRCPSLTHQERSRVYRAAIRQGLVVVADGNREQEWHLPATPREGFDGRSESDHQRRPPQADAATSTSMLSIGEAQAYLQGKAHRFPHPGRYYLLLSIAACTAMPSFKFEPLRAKRICESSTLLIVGSFLRAAQAVTQFEAVAVAHMESHQTTRFVSVDIKLLDTDLESTIRRYAIRHANAEPTSHGKKPRHGSDAFAAPLALYPLPFHVAVNDDPAIQAVEASRWCQAYLRKAFAAPPPPSEVIFATHHRTLSRGQLQALVWVEEVAAQSSLRLYDMYGCKFTQGSFHTYRLKVPGLAEKRPSVLVGDLVRIVDEATNQLHHGYVHFVHHDDVDIDVDRGHLKLQTATYTVQFTVKRTDFRLLHRAITETRVFLSPALAAPHHPSTTPTVDYRVASQLNALQRQFVRSTLDGSNRLGLLWGPPGTGKTTTLVRYIESLLSGRTPHAHPLSVLACTPSNASADLLLIKLIECGAVRPGQAIRVVSYSRSVEELDPKLLPFICTEEEAASHGELRPPKRVFRTPTWFEVESATILVMTLGCCGRFYGCHPDFRCTHLVVDEAGQTTEAELCLALSFCDDKTQKVVIGGDPKQLGPVTQSLEARPYGAADSPLQRLLDSGDASVLACTTTLEENYRSHPTIIGLVNQFYEGRLREPLLGGSKYDAVGWRSPRVVWHHGAAQEQYEANSPSIFNMEEVDRVIQYVDAIVTNCGVSIRDIAILAPYIKQVQKVRQVMRLALGHLYVAADGGDDLLKRNVCSIEAFQGREARVVIITTVRTTDDVELLKADCRRHLGFVGQAQRTNVAVSRAIDALVVLGNLKLLARDAKTWGPLLRTSLNDPTHVVDGIDRMLLTEILDRGADALGLSDEAPPDGQHHVHADTTVFARRLDD